MRRGMGPGVWGNDYIFDINLHDRVDEQPKSTVAVDTGSGWIWESENDEDLTSLKGLIMKDGMKTHCSVWRYTWKIIILFLI